MGLAGALAASMLVACGADGPAPVETAPDDTDPERTCVPGEGVDARPTTIEAAVALAQSLPRPLSVACYVESLERPLYVVASSSSLSAQPAVGITNPRLFLLSGALITSVVPAGTGAHLVEFGQLIGDARSIKGELVFPIEGPIAPEAPFEHLLIGDGVTSCALCHPGEAEAYAAGSTFAYATRAFRPDDDTLVDIEALRAEVGTCDAELEPERCDLLRELFGNGAVKPESFPPLPTFFE